MELLEKMAKKSLTGCTVRKSDQDSSSAIARFHLNENGKGTEKDPQDIRQLVVDRL